MELREWATRILSADTLDEKLLSPEHMTDHIPGSPLRFNEPVRPQGMGFQRHTRNLKLPAFHEHHLSDHRAACLHRFAGHELLAVEIMAQALLAFPDAPKHFRRGLANTLKEEQEHVRLYVRRLGEMGVQFGDLPLNRHFWNYVPHLIEPIHYVSVMSLTFEMANLDFAPLYGKSFERAGDALSAQLMQRIFEDEISHVSFGWNWLKKFKAEEKSEWDAWEESLPHPLTPKRATGFVLHEEGRRRAMIPEEWIQKFKKIT